MYSLRYLIISTLITFLTGGLYGQLISVRSQIEHDSILIGDQMVFTLHVEAEDHVDFQLPALKDTLTKNIEVLFPITSDTIVSEGKRIVDHRYMITSFEAGMQMVPAQEVVYATSDILDTALSMPVLMHVIEPLIDTAQQIKPIKPPLNTPLTFREALPWILIGLGGLAIAIVVYILFRRYFQRKNDPEKFSLKPQEPAHVIAFRQLDLLKDEKLWEKGKVKQYYSRLTGIARHYIERQYGIPAMESTTDEIIHSFRKTNTDDALLDEMLKELLELADLVKFAKEDPLPVDNQTNLNNAYIFIQKTYPMFFSEILNDKERGEEHA